jgi:hypothetical protein
MDDSNRLVVGGVEGGDGGSVSEPLSHVGALVLSFDTELLKEGILTVCQCGSHGWMKCVGLGVGGVELRTGKTRLVESAEPQRFSATKF